MKLWSSRGLYPGLLRVLEAAGAEALIDRAKTVCETKGQEAAHQQAFDALERKAENAVSAGLSAPDLNRLIRQWSLLDEDAQTLLRDVLPRFDLETESITRILSENRAAHGLTADLTAVAENPYLLAEQYIGQDASDRIPWSVIDRGALPSPELGPPLASVDYNDARRFRALCVEHLRTEPNHTFRFARELLLEITTRIARLPEWKQASFSEPYFKVDAEFLSEALVLQPRDLGLTIYLRPVFEDERLVERTLRDLSARPDISVKRWVSAEDWRTWTFKAGSALALNAADDYEKAVAEAGP